MLRGDCRVQRSHSILEHGINSTTVKLRREEKIRKVGLRMNIKNKKQEPRTQKKTDKHKNCAVQNRAKTNDSTLEKLWFDKQNATGTGN